MGNDDVAVGYSKVHCKTRMRHTCESIHFHDRRNALTMKITKLAHRECRAETKTEVGVHPVIIRASIDRNRKDRIRSTEIIRVDVANSIRMCATQFGGLITYSVSVAGRNIA